VTLTHKEPESQFLPKLLRLSQTFSTTLWRGQIGLGESPLAKSRPLFYPDFQLKDVCLLKEKR